MAKAKKLPSGNWRVRVTKDGETRSFTDSDKRTVELKAAEWLNNISPDIHDKLSVANAVDKYIAAKSSVLSPYTIHSYKNIAKNNISLIGRQQISKLNNEQIQIWINNLSMTLSAKTVKNAYGLLNATLRVYRPNYIPQITLPQRKKPELIIPNQEQIKKLIQATEGKNIQLAIMLAALCGMREGEICALNSEDISNGKIHVSKAVVYDDTAKEWKIKAPKSFSGDRYIDMPDIVQSKLKEKKGKIFEYTPNGLRNTYKKSLKKENLPAIRFHDLRHFYVSELFDAGLPEKYIIAQVGHSSASITKAVYDHLNEQRKSRFSSISAEHFDNILK